MILTCHHCGSKNDWGKAKCTRCDKPLDLIAILKADIGKLWRGVNRTVAIKCPVCQQANSALAHDRCTNCNSHFTVASVLVPILRPLRERWDRLQRNRTALAIARVLYAVISVVAFFWVLGFTDLLAENMGTLAVLSFVYLAFLTLFFLWIIPKKGRPGYFFLPQFAKSLKPFEKIGLLANYFTLLLLLQFAFQTWTEKAIAIAMLFGISWLGFYVFLNYVYPVWLGMASFFEGPTVVFQVTNDQGRTARWDREGPDRFDLN